MQTYCRCRNETGKYDAACKVRSPPWAQPVTQESLAKSNSTKMQMAQHRDTRPAEGILLSRLLSHHKFIVLKGVIDANSRLDVT